MIPTQGCNHEKYTAAHFLIFHSDGKYNAGLKESSKILCRSLYEQEFTC